jgi:hypothetical protein
MKRSGTGMYTLEKKVLRLYKPGQRKKDCAEQGLQIAENNESLADLKRFKLEFYPAC